MAIEHGTNEQIAATFNVMAQLRPHLPQAAYHMSVFGRIDNLTGEHSSAEIAAYLKLAGPDVQKSIERDPYPEIEHQSRRGYVFAQRAKSCNFS
jgi:hypothetical protein